jgi:histidyl-tRNA synthetase
MLRTIAGVYHRYGFDALESSAVETVEALGKFLPDVDRPNEGVFAWQEGEEEGNGDWLALRYDLTAPLARVYAQHRNDLPTPYRRYAMGPVWPTRSRVRDDSASFINVMQIPLARRRSPLIPRSAPCSPIALRPLASRAATT